VVPIFHITKRLALGLFYFLVNHILEWKFCKEKQKIGLKTDIAHRAEIRTQTNACIHDTCTFPFLGHYRTYFLRMLTDGYMCELVHFMPSANVSHNSEILTQKS
jgi:hypothetical protein